MWVSRIMSLISSSPSKGRTWTPPLPTTGGEVRGSDRWGSGHFGAPRGNRKHLGTDYLGEVGDNVVAVTSGVVDKLGFCYSDDLSFRYVRFVCEGGYTVRQLYVYPMVVMGQEVAKGERIGLLQTLGDRYPDISDHCHTDIKYKRPGRNQWVDPETLIDKQR